MDANISKARLPSQNGASSHAGHQRNGPQEVDHASADADYNQVVPALGETDLPWG